MNAKQRAEVLAVAQPAPPPIALPVPVPVAAPVVAPVTAPAPLAPVKSNGPPGDKKTEVAVKNYPPKVVASPPAKVVEVPAGPVPTFIAPDTTRRVKKATAYLRVTLANGQEAQGSGFFAAEPGLVFTNAHVLGMLSPASQMPTGVAVVVNSGEPGEFTLPGQVRGAWTERPTLGVLRVNGDPGRLPAPLAIDTSAALTELQKVYVFGFPFGSSLGKNITVSDSSVSSLRRGPDGGVKEIQVNGGMSPGNSGGPVVDSRGVVVGVAVAIIRGTQINFAVPGEKVQQLLRGRVTEVEFGEPYLENAQVKLPVHVLCLDPMRRIRDLKAELWTGNPGPARPLALKKPDALPGDGGRLAVALNYVGGKAQGDRVLPAVAAAQVVWIQPALTDAAGAVHWARATTFQPAEHPPIQRKAAALQARFDTELRKRTPQACMSFKLELVKGSSPLTIAEHLDMDALETAQPGPRGGDFRLIVNGCKLSSEINGKVVPVNVQAQKLLRGKSLTFITHPTGALSQNSKPTLKATLPLILRQDFDDMINQISNAYEMTCLSVPNRQLQAREPWQTKLPMMLVIDGRKQIVDLHVTCTYEGSRLHEGQNQALIVLAGDRAPQAGSQHRGRQGQWENVFCH